MLPRFHWSDITTVGHYLGVLILVTGAVMCVPAIVALVFGEMQQLGAFIASIGTCFALGSSLLFLKSKGLDRRRSLLLIGFGWIAIGFVCAMPFVFSGAFDLWFDALFESVSALTTTGVSIASNIDTLAYSQITWRTIMSFIGAQVVVVMSLLFGFFGDGPRIQMFNGRRNGDRLFPRIRQTCSMVMAVYGAFAIIGVVAATIICFTLGLSPVDALMNGFWMAITALGTGSFVPHTSDLIYYHSLSLQIVLCTLMLVGSLSFGVFVYARIYRFKRVINNTELRVYWFWIALLVAFITVIMTRDGIFTSLAGFIQNGLVTAVSAATTCGMQAVYPEQFGISITDGIVMLIILAIFLGSCAYSTGGGIKFVRILQVLRWIRYSIFVRLVPSNAHVRIKYEHFGSQMLNSQDAIIAMMVSILYLATAALGSMAFIAFGNDALSSVFEAVSYVSNCGMTAEITQAGLPLPLKVVALLLMWAGRVEFVALIAAVVGIIISLHPNNLFSNMRSRDLRLFKNDNFGGSAWRSRKNKDTKDKTKTLMVAGLLVVSLGLSPLGVQAAQAAPESTRTQTQETEATNSSSEFASVDIHALLSAGERQNNREVMFTGEAVGEPIYADDQNVWINTKSDNAMIGVFMTSDQAAQIASFARYEQTGDMLQVCGTYHLACAQHNGELDVHASIVSIDAPGEEVKDPVASWTYAYGVIMIVIGCILFLNQNPIHKKIRLKRFFEQEDKR